MKKGREVMNVVFAGHVDHGKSTVIGRLLYESGALPDGKLESIKEKCRRQSKVFEYAFLLDALIDEQDQGITIDVARCFFKTKKRTYLILDAPGHIEFLKNMISGAARAEAAFLVIDAKEGVQENSRRHGYMLSMLGIRQVMVVVTKMDLVGYDRRVFEDIKKEYTEFLGNIGVKPIYFLPVSGIEGENIAKKPKKMRWFKGKTVLAAIDSFKKEKPSEEKPFRMPVQDVYKFTAKGDNRRIMAGRVESGTIRSGDDVVFLPSGKRSTIKKIEDFTKPEVKEMSVGYSTGFTLTEQIYVNRGEIMCKDGEELPAVSSLIKCNIFWMGREPMVKEKEYKLKLGTVAVNCRLKEIINVLDASTLEKEKRSKIKRHEVAECLIECQSPITFDLAQDIQNTGRFVIVDEYEVAGGGIITESIPDTQQRFREQVFLREEKWYRSEISFTERAINYGQMPRLILITGKTPVDKKTIARELEKKLFYMGRKVYFLGIGNLLRGVDADIGKKERKEHVRRLGEVSHILMDAGLIVIATASDLTKEELKLLETIVLGEEFIKVYVGEKPMEDESLLDLFLNRDDELETNVAKILDMLKFKDVIFNA
jgi:bifunctional enzyme CysN/CysC